MQVKNQSDTKTANFFGLAVVLGCLLLWMQCITQYVAAKLAFQPELGTGLPLWGHAKLYYPWAYALWNWQFGHLQELMPLFKAANIYMLGGTGTIVIGGLIIVATITRRLGSIKDYNPFSSEWADDIDVEFSGLLARDSWATKAEIDALKKKSEKK